MYIVKRNGSTNYYYREAVPNDVKAFLRRSGEKCSDEVWKSLGTPVRAEAKRKLVVAQALQHRAWALVTGQSASEPPSLRVPTTGELRIEIVKLAYDKYRTLLERKRATLKSASEPEWDEFISGEQTSHDRWRRRLLTSDHEMSEQAIDKLTAYHGWDFPKFENNGNRAEKYIEACGDFTIAYVDAQQTNLAELRGEPFAAAKSHIVQTAKEDAQNFAPSGQALLELFEAYASKRLGNNSKRQDTIDQERKTWVQFAQTVGVSRAARSISKSDVREFRNVLESLPVKYASRADSKGLGLREIAKQALSHGLEMRSAKTIAKEISALSAVFVWLIREGYAEENPTVGLSPQVDKSTGRLPPFTMVQLNILFNSPLYTGCQQGRGREHLPGDHRISDWRFWLPLLALFTGARIGELAQLRNGDINQVDGHWMFNITDDATTDDSIVSAEVPAKAARLLKSRAAKRAVPIHPMLMKIGILRLRTDNAEDALFMDIIPNSRGQISGVPSRFFRTYLERIGLKTPGLGSHSFRHGFTDECRLRGHMDDIIGTLVGHAKGTMTSRYGASQEGNIAQRVALMCSLRYDGVNLDQLVQSPTCADPL